MAVSTPRAWHRLKPSASIEEPQVAIAEADGEVVLGQPETGETLDEQRDQLDLGLRAGFAEDVGVELVKGPAAALRARSLAVKLGDAEPLDRPLQGAGLLADHPADVGVISGRRETSRPPFVGEN